VVPAVELPLSALVTEIARAGLRCVSGAVDQQPRHLTTHKEKLTNYPVHTVLLIRSVALMKIMCRDLLSAARDAETCGVFLKWIDPAYGTLSSLLHVPV
jgi:hypothetical protein